MNKLFYTAFLLFVWCGFSENISMITLLSGLVVAIVMQWAFLTHYHTKISLHLLPFIRLLGFTLSQLVISSIEVAREIVSRKQYSNPKVLRLKHNCKHPFQLLLLTNIISLTPGTLFIDLSRDGKSIIFHDMFASDDISESKEKCYQVEEKVLKALTYE